MIQIGSVKDKVQDEWPILWWPLVAWVAGSRVPPEREGRFRLWVVGFVNKKSMVGVAKRTRARVWVVGVVRQDDEEEKVEGLRWWFVMVRRRHQGKKKEQRESGELMAANNEEFGCEIYGCLLDLDLLSIGLTNWDDVCLGLVQLDSWEGFVEDIHGSCSSIVEM
ncbi:hypothetical protein Drorol1_Dr00011550 [Drosera rotundifolia]